MKHIIKKIYKSLKNDGMIKTVRKVIGCLKYKFSIKIHQKNNSIFKKYLDINSFENVIIFENNFGWNKIMKQRPQQIAENLPENTLMIYHTHEDSDFNDRHRIRKIKNNLLLVDLGYYRDILFNEINVMNKFLMIYSTDFIEYDRIKLYENHDYKIIYEYVDDINEDLMGKDMYDILTYRHEQIMNNNNVIISVTASLLQEKAKKMYDRDSLLVTNGVNYETFKYQEYDLPDDLVNIKKNHKYLVCYYGALASWFDYGLINELAQNESYGIVLIGQDYDKTLEKSKILDNKNVYYLGRKDYNDLPKYGCNMDVLLIPFVINDITKATSPVKIFEYMAMEKPIVTTNMPECKKYKSVLISKNHKEFIKNIEKAIHLIKDKKYIITEIEEAKSNDWSQKASSLVYYAVREKSAIAEKKLKEALDGNYERIIVWRSPFGWNVPLFQRPQHIARQFAKKGCLVFYEVTSSTDVVDTIKEQENNLFLVNFSNIVAHDMVFEKLRKINKPKYIQIYSTNWSMSLDEMKDYMKDGFNILYEYIDDISPDLAGTDEIPPYILEKYNYVMNDKNIPVVVTANKICDDVDKKRKGRNFAFACNGVDYKFFKDIDIDYKYENDFLNIINNGKVNLCYYGALAKWFDYDLIKKINATNEYNIILFGVKYDDAYDASGIDKFDNVYFLGSKDYHVLKNYACKMDILTIPFVINSITKATSPLKLFEYMALGKPIVTSAMDECLKYKSVMAAKNHDEFLEYLSKAKDLINDKKYLNLLDKEAKDNDWSKKADEIIKLLKNNEK